MVLGKLPVPGRPTIWIAVGIAVGQGPTALAVGAGGGCLDIFTLIYPFSPLTIAPPDHPLKVLGKLSVLGRPTTLDESRARAYCSCSRCGRVLFGTFFHRLSFLFSFSLSLGDGPI